MFQNAGLAFPIGHASEEDQSAVKALFSQIFLPQFHASGPDVVEHRRLGIAVIG